LVSVTIRNFTYLLLWVLIFSVSTNLFAGEPEFSYGLKYPPAYIASYPERSTFPVISITYQTFPKFRMIYSSSPRVTRSSFEDNSLTITGAYYKKGKYLYEYTPRSVDARAFMEYRRKQAIARKMSEFHSKALAKEQKHKKGGLLSVNIPIRSKAVESIFGEGGAGLNVSGFHQIVFSGRSQWDDRNVTSTFKQSKFPSLNMEQISRFDIKGTIGSKVTVSVSQDSKTDIPLANRIIIRYKGEEDDIIKSIEAGNTTLSLPKTRLVGYSSRIQGLFGIKTTAQIGGLSMTAIASQEKGSTERTTINAGSSASKVFIRDWEYYDGKIYDLGRESDFNSGDVIIQLNVYANKTSYTGDNVTGDTAIMYVDPDDISNTTYSNENSDAIEVSEIESAEFWLNEYEHWIMFSSPYAGSKNSYIGVYMVILKANGDTVKIGDIESNPMKLKLIKNSSPDVSMVSWDYVWRNVYYLKSTNIDVEGLELNIYKGPKGTEITVDNLDHQDGTQYIRILGLDQYDSRKPGEKSPDGNVDVNTGIIEPEFGLLIFPNRTPFYPSENIDSTALKDTVPEIYSNSYAHVDAQNASKYYIEVSNRSRSSEISLGKFNIIDGSEVVTLNGRQLTRGDDYRINYDIGRINFLTDEALDPNANLDINYEFSPFAMMQKKTLFGIGAEYELSKNFEFGATFLYKSDKATERKPKIGQETTRMIIWDANTRFNFKSNLITKLANAIPFYSTEAPSSFAVQAEIAQSHPDPNVDDVAYLDDFEGSRDMYSLGVYRENWYYTSKPVVLDSSNIRGKLYWYNPYDQTDIKQIWNRDVGSVSHTHILKLEFIPGDIDRRLGEYTDYSDCVSDRATSWSGIMRCLPRGASNQDRAQLLELRLNGEHGIMHIEMGEISEDFNGDGNKTTEDVNPANNYLDDGEDVGLDGMTDGQERVAMGIEDSTHLSYYSDPFDDNYYYNAEDESQRNNYSNINGTQGDSTDPGALGRPSSEDIDRNRMFNERNNYFSYEIDLSDPVSPFFVNGSEYNQWRSFRIPIKDEKAIVDTVGTPNWTKIDFVRIWFECPGDTSQIPDTIKLKIAAMDIVSSNWDDTLIKIDSTDTLTQFSVGVINTQENEYYREHLPPNVEGYYDPINNVIEPEQSLLLHLVNFRAVDSLNADTGIAERILFDTPNLMGYRKLQMYVHGPDYYTVGDETVGDSILFFFRIGADNNNYYEFRKILVPGWEGNNVEIDFNEITGRVKKELIQIQKDDPTIKVLDKVVGGKHYRVVGDPNITRIKYLAAGAANLDPDNPVTTDIWLDELRLTDVRRDVGLATNVGVSGTFADLFNYRFGYSYKNSFFRQISTSTRGGSANNLGSGSTNKKFDVGISGFNLNKFLPRSLGASIPLSFSYSKAVTIPILQSRSDIILPEELRDEESTISTSKRFTVSESFNRKTKNPLFTVLLNPLKTSFSYNRTNSKSPIEPMRISENYNIRSSYSYNLKNTPNIKPLFWTKPVPILRRLGETRFYLLPNSLSLSGVFDRNLTVRRNINNVLNNSPPKRNFSGNMKVGYKISDNLNANYSMSTKRDMSDPELVIFSFNPKKFKLGRETFFSQSFGSTYSPTLFSFFTHKFTFTSSYRENIDVVKNAHRASSSKGYGVSGSLDLKKLFGKGDSRSSDSRASKYKRKQLQEEKSDSTKSDTGPKKSIFKRVTGPFSKFMRFLTGWIDPISYGFTESYGYSYPSLLQRAQSKFRFGFSDDVGVEMTDKASSGFKSNSITKSTKYNFKSGTVFLGGLRTDVSFSRSINQDIVRSGSRQKKVSTIFPDINFSIRQLKTFTFLNPIIKRFSPRTKYSRNKSESFNLTTSYKSSEKVTTSQNPLLAINFGIMKGLQINLKTDRSVTETKKYNSANGALTDRRRSISGSSSVSTKYAFSWPTGIKIPLLGRIKFKSTMSISVDVSTRSTKDEMAQGDGPLNSTGERSDLMITTSMSYSFSSQIKGGLSGRWQDTDDKKTKRKSHTRELRIWVDIRF